MYNDFDSIDPARLAWFSAYYCQTFLFIHTSIFWPRILLFYSPLHPVPTLFKPTLGSFKIQLCPSVAKVLLLPKIYICRVVRILGNLRNLGFSWDKKLDLGNLRNLGFSWDFFIFPQKKYFQVICSIMNSYNNLYTLL